MSEVELGLWVAGGSVGFFGLGVLVYALGTHVLMRAHTDPRPFGLWLRALWRETFLSIVTQPFLPLFYFLGDRMEWLLLRRGKRAFVTKVPVVLVHGYMQNRVGFLGLARELARRGIGPLYAINYPWLASIPSNARRLARYVDRVRKETKSDQVDLVCHSMGGLVAMEMMRDEAAKDHLKIRRCVTIATPHAGVAWRGPMIGFGATSLRRGSKLLTDHAGYKLAVPTLSIFSTHDNMVHPRDTSRLTSRGGRDVEVEGLGHLAILFSPVVADHVASFLIEPGPGSAIVAAHDERGSDSDSDSEGAGVEP